MVWVLRGAFYVERRFHFQITRQSEPWIGATRTAFVWFMLKNIYIYGKLETYRVGAPSSVNCKAEKLHLRWLFMPLREAITHAGVLLWGRNREDDFFFSTKRATTCTLNSFPSHGESKDLYTDNRFQAYTGLPPNNCLLSQLSLSIWLKEVLFFNLFWIDSRHEVDYWERLNWNYREGPDRFPQESVLDKKGPCRTN